MKRSRIGISAVALLSASALALAGCSASEAPAEGDTAAIITTNGSEPQQALIPTNTTKTGGGKVVTSIFAGLVSYTVDGDVVNEVAESIESEDGQNWTVTLNDGWTFTNGEAVTSDSFVKAWQYGALLSNAQSSSYFFDNIEGFSYDEDSELTGLEVVSDTEFTVALNNPEADFPLRLGYSAFMPLPESAWEDLDAFGENPVGNGPYMLDGEDAWQHDVQIDLVTNPDYASP